MFNWVKEIQSWIPFFDEVKFACTSRKSNILADKLAKASMEENVYVKSYSFVPQCITSALHYDYLLLELIK